MLSRRDRASGLVYVDPRPRGAARGLAVVLHGRGASKEDLLELGEVLVADGFRVLLPDAPIPWGPGWAWYESEARGRDLPTSRAAVAKLVASARREEGFEADRTLLVGFSQGGVLSLDLALNEPEVAHHVACLSGYLSVGEAPERVAKAPRVFLAHGTSDDVVTFDRGAHARRLLEERGALVEWHAYDGMAHSICDEEIGDLRTWVAAIC